MALAVTEPGVRLAVGVSGSGKSHGIVMDVRRAVRAGVPVVVVDSMHEWTHVPRDIAKLVTALPSDARRADIEAAVSGGKRLIVIRTRTAAATIRAAETACAWAIRHAGLAGVAIPEAWQVAPSHGALPPMLATVTRAWRHKRVCLWLDAQRVSMVSRHVTELARELRFYATAGDRDFLVMRDIGGQALVAAVRECAVKLAAGEPGWHVSLGVRRIGPYTIERSPRE